MTINKALKILEKVSDDVNCNFCPIYGDDLEGKCTIYKDGECPIGEAIEMARDALRKQRKQEKTR